MSAVTDWVTAAGAVVTAGATIYLAIFARNGFRATNETAQKAVELERAKWVAQLNSEFFSERFRRVRAALDVPAGQDTDLKDLISREDEELTEFLNLFELVSHLEGCCQITRKDVLDLFGYYLKLFKRHAGLLHYISKPSNSYEQLKTLLSSL